MPTRHLAPALNTSTGCIFNAWTCSFFCLSKKIEPKKRTPIVGISPAVNQAQNLASLHSWISKLLSLYSYYWIILLQSEIFLSFLRPPASRAGRQESINSQKNKKVDHGKIFNSGLLTFNAEPLTLML